MSVSLYPEIPSGSKLIGAAAGEPGSDNDHERSEHSGVNGPAPPTHSNTLSHDKENKRASGGQMGSRKRAYKVILFLNNPSTCCKQVRSPVRCMERCTARS